MSNANHLVSPKQIAAFELYDRLGSEYLHIGIGIRNKDRLRVEKAWHSLIHQREILRSLLIYQDSCLYRNVLPMDKEQFQLEFEIVEQGDELERIVTQRIRVLNKYPVNNKRLFYGVVYEFEDNYVIILFINHIIGNTAALGILKEDFITLYKDNSAIIQLHSFEDYVLNQVSRLRKGFLAEYDFHKNKLNAIIPGMVKANGLAVDLRDNQSFINSITVKTFDHRKYFLHTPKKKPEGSVFCQLSSYLMIPNYRGIKCHKFSLYTVVVASYLKAMNEFYTNGYYFQFLMDYKNSKYALRQIGDFSGDFYMTNILSVLEGADLLSKVQMELFKTYKAHAIYNYQMFDIDVGGLFSNCNMLVNYTPLNVVNEDDPVEDLVEISYDYVRAHNANFELSVDTNGFMSYRILFNEQVHTKSFIDDFNTLWRLNMQSFLTLF
ncbi:hypothetical protein AY601_3537 [Pedobacter cryoconitis]|uniref:Condensation domain-containing protein n=1 Tax=Pedobacter cryoconitis TaxID=188932 RepID=A0A127VGQ6_9SPHI|nr:condensation domain-containing protein [Pedobacter cryoconitis]AMQ00402.1 hypothetical protein AY601_3537 [Pedobacter cryoconitis]